MHDFEPRPGAMLDTHPFVESLPSRASLCRSDATHRPDTPSNLGPERDGQVLLSSRFSRSPNATSTVFAMRLARVAS
jgi:hypothetical protein